MNYPEQHDPEPLRELDWTTVGGPSHAVTTVMADVRGVDPIDLDPLFDDIDPEALDAICDSGRSGECTVEFSRGAYDVVVGADGTCAIYGQDEAAVDGGRTTDSQSADRDRSHEGSESDTESDGKQRTESPLR